MKTNKHISRIMKQKVGKYGLQEVREQRDGIVARWLKQYNIFLQDAVNSNIKT